MKSTSELLLEMAPTVGDKWVAMALTNKCVELTDSPFRFAINHDIRPPKNLACPLVYHWTRKDRVGVEMASRHKIVRWLTEAFELGYTVYLMNAQGAVVGPPHSIKIARHRAEVHQRPRPKFDDEDIPF